MVAVLFSFTRRGGCRLKRMLHVSMHADWKVPHSLEWYRQLGESVGKYVYPWKSTIQGPDGEMIFDGEVLQMIPNQKVLDVGCGHGDFSVKCGVLAKEVVGFDVTAPFLKQENLINRDNVSFVIGDTKDGLPFQNNEFDCAFIRKGPTSAYPLLKEIVKEGGRILGIHPGDQSGIELWRMYPDLFSEQKGIIQKLENRLANSGFKHIEIETVNTKEFLSTPIDVIKMCCFGQSRSVMEWVLDERLDEISDMFNRNKSSEGLAITNSRYIVRVIV